MVMLMHQLTRSTTRLIRVDLDTQLLFRVATSVELKKHTTALVRLCSATGICVSTASKKASGTTLWKDGGPTRTQSQTNNRRLVSWRPANRPVLAGRSSPEIARDTVRIFMLLGTRTRSFEPG